MAKVAELKTTMPELEKAAADAEKKLNDILAAIPNIPLDEVPDGADEKGNVEYRKFGTPNEFQLHSRSSISILAKRSARWISRPRPSCRARASSF